MVSRPRVKYTWNSHTDKTAFSCFYTNHQSGSQLPTKKPHTFGQETRNSLGGAHPPAPTANRHHPGHQKRAPRSPHADRRHPGMIRFLSVTTHGISCWLPFRTPLHPQQAALGVSHFLNNHAFKKTVTYRWHTQHDQRNHKFSVPPALDSPLDVVATSHAPLLSRRRPHIHLCPSQQTHIYPSP